jgi:hypothetical protein
MNNGPPEQALESSFVVISSPLIVLLVAFLLAGCNKEKSAVLAGGKPIEHWVAAARDPNEKVRKQAIQKLGNVGNADPAVLPVLISALKDANSGIRREAIIAIVKYGPGAEQAIDALKTVAATDADPQIRGYAAQAASILSRS